MSDEAKVSGRNRASGERKKMIDMTMEEKRDMLLENLAALYRIKAVNKEENAVLDHEIRVTEKRLEVLGVTDLAALKP